MSPRRALHTSHQPKIARLGCTLLPVASETYYDQTHPAVRSSQPQNFLSVLSRVWKGCERRQGQCRPVKHKEQLGLSHGICRGGQPSSTLVLPTLQTISCCGSSVVSPVATVQPLTLLMLLNHAQLAYLYAATALNFVEGTASQWISLIHFVALNATV
jgi:hypothetical protein